MAEWSKPVFSSMVSTVGYDPDQHVLYLTWSNGRTSGYADVPEEKAVDCSNAPSVGQFVNQEIKPYYKHLGYVR